MRNDLIERNQTVREMAKAQPTVWINPDYDGQNRAEACGLTMADILDAEARLARFAPFLIRCFPETAARHGLIESPLTRIPAMLAAMNAAGDGIEGELFLKQDSHLAVAGSVKARGGIYEVLKHTEELALKNGILQPGGDYAALADQRAFFGKYKMQVGSTGNLGLSIGITSAAIGYHTVVHMSADAKQWKKDLLRSKGVTVVEYASDYSEAVKQGRALSDADEYSYFVDDENSTALFLGYAVAALRLKQQLEEQHIAVDAAHPLFVYIPCGVGGAPGGVAFGLKQVFGRNVSIFFVEPVQAPCMLLGMASGENEKICVQDVGLSGKTQADGLAVGRPSGFVGKAMQQVLSGGFTLTDDKLFLAMRALYSTEHIFIEPSAAAAFAGVRGLFSYDAARAYLKEQGFAKNMANAVHIAWATGGSLVPEDIRKEYLTGDFH